MDRNGYSIEIEQDTGRDDSPRDWDNLGTILYTGTRYTLGDKQVDREEMIDIIGDPDYIHLPVYAYIHGGVTINTTGYRSYFDSGMCGIIYVSKADVREEFGKQRISKKLMALVLKVLRGEIEVLDQYYTGDVWGYTVTDERGELVDSCWGFYGHEYCKQEAIDIADWHYNQSWHQSDFLHLVACA